MTIFYFVIGIALSLLVGVLAIKYDKRKIAVDQAPDTGIKKYVKKFWLLAFFIFILGIIIWAGTNGGS